MIRGTLSEICSAVIDCKNRTAPEDPKGTHFAVGTPAMRGNILNLNEARRINDETFVEWTARLAPEPGDLLFAREAPVGPVIEIPEGISIAPGQRTMLLRADPSKANNRFLRYYLLSPLVQARLHALAHGSTVPHLRLPVIRNFEVELPELNEQQAIAEVLGALDDKIVANTKLAETLAEMATAQFELCSMASSLPVPLSDLVTTQYGVTTASHQGPGPRFLRVTDINKKPWIEWASTPFCTVSENDLKKYKVTSGDILVARMADPGKAAFVDHGDPEAVFASYLVRLRALNTDHALFIYYFLRSSTYRSYAEGVMQGSVQLNMNAKVIVATDIAMPTVDSLSNFNNIVSTLRAQIQAVLSENLLLASTRDTLLPQLMSGKLLVMDAEALVEAVV